MIDSLTVMPLFFGKIAERP